MKRFEDLRITGTGFEGLELHPTVTIVVEGGASRLVQSKGDNGFYAKFSAGFPLFLIREVWVRGVDLEAEADGYGPGAGTHDDWSGIRDSSAEAIERMLEKALNFIFPHRLG